MPVPRVRTRAGEEDECRHRSVHELQALNEPPCRKPPLVSSDGPPGAWTKPSRLMNSITTTRIFIPIVRLYSNPQTSRHAWIHRCPHPRWTGMASRSSRRCVSAPRPGLRSAFRSSLEPEDASTTTTAEICSGGQTRWRASAPSGQRAMKWRRLPTVDLGSMSTGSIVTSGSLRPARPRATRRSARRRSMSSAPSAMTLTWAPQSVCRTW